MTAALFPFSQSQPIAHAILVLATVAVAGLALGSVAYRGIALGSAGVVFAGILFGHFGERVDHRVLDFVKEFGLVLFVFTIGLQLGPGFGAALREQGLKLNALAVATVLLGAAVAALCVAVLGVDPAAAAGLFSGATTNTPSLGAAQQALATLPQKLPPDRAALPALAYAVAYPLGVVGIIGSLLVLKRFFGIDPVREAEAFAAGRRGAAPPPPERRNLVVENAQLDNLRVADLPGRHETGVVVSRVRRSADGRVVVATEETVLHAGDVLLAVGTPHGLDQFTRIVGRAADVDLATAPGAVTHRRVVVTRREALGRTVAELGLDPRFGVAVTRVTRGDLEMTAVPDLRLRFGDVLQVVGEPDGVTSAAAVLGNATRELNVTQFIPMFIGIALGVLVGMVPVSVPGMSAPVRLGLAGGPLIVGILVSRLGHFRGLVWHMPMSANLALREMGITLFLAAIGLTAGEKFFETAFTRTGLLWIGCAAAVTVVPLLAVGAAARVVFKLNYTTISGLVAGSTTDPPALAFATRLTQSEWPHVAYATVYPLTMVLRIVAAQAMVMLLCR